MFVLTSRVPVDGVTKGLRGYDILPVGIALGGSLSQRLTEALPGVVMPAPGSLTVGDAVKLDPMKPATP
jgi:hypothetical protein